MSRFAATLRIARRDARRAKGRSALVIAMIALPVLGVGAADVVFRTFELSAEQQATRLMGAADVRLEDSGNATVSQTANGYGSDSELRTGRAPDPVAVLPVGSRVLTDRAAGGDVVVEGRRTSTELRELDLTDPLAAGLFTVVSGDISPGPDETVLTQSLADRLGAGLGDRVGLQVRGAGATLSRTVVGLVQSTSTTRSQSALLAAGSLEGVPEGLYHGQARVTHLVDLPRAPVWADVQRANAVGLLLEGRVDIPGGPPSPYVSLDEGVAVEAAAVVALIVGMALLEVVLLAGPAFAVGTKRQSRELALLAATGGDRSDVRRTVLSSGVVLGVVGGLVGVGGAVALGAVATPVLTRLNGDLPGPFEVRPIELLALAAVGTVTAVLAALLPARSASRQDVVAALTGRRGTLRSSRVLPLVGLLAAAAGGAVALYGADRREITVVLAGSALAELGLVATTPSLVALAGRLGPWLPVAPRLALRDAARNRGRTAPAVSAILAAVAGSVAVATYVASLDQHDRESYSPSAPVGRTVLTTQEASDRSLLGAAEAALRRILPGHEVVRVRAVEATVTGLDASPGYVSVIDVPEQVCPAYLDALPEAERFIVLTSDVRCTARTDSPQVGAGVLVGGPDLLQAVTGYRAPAYDAVLAAGGAVVPRRALRADGTADVAVIPSVPAGGAPPEPRLTRVRAIGLPLEGMQVAVLSEAAAARVGAPVVTTALVAVGETPTAEQEDRLLAAVSDTGISASPVVERGYQSDYGIGLLALMIGSAVIVLGASGIATGLAAADARADLSTLAAVGASPGVRRRLAAFQSAVTAGLGTVLGTVAGLVPAIGLLVAVNRPPDGAPPGFTRPDPFPIVMPWENLLVTVLVVSLLAALAAALLTRSRLPLVRRAA